MCLNTLCGEKIFRGLMPVRVGALIVAAGIAMLGVQGSMPVRALSPGSDALPPVLPNDNTRAAGSPDGDTVTIRLRADKGAWRPEGDGGRALVIEAFGEEGRPLSVPAPLIRVTEGATI